MKQSLPILLYHYLRGEKNSIAVSPETFAAHLRAMRRGGYRGIGLDEAADSLLSGRPLPKGAVLITFDDGFLDNYVHGWPLLEEYGHKAVIFGVTGRIPDHAPAHSGPRPTRRDLTGGRAAQSRPSGPGVDLPAAHVPEPAWPGGPEGRRDLFFSWEEARAMEASTVVAVAGHSHRHRSVFIGDEYTEFFRPGPRVRSFDRIDSRIAYGMPLFPVGPALASRAFLPSDELLGRVTDLVPQDPAEADVFLRDQRALAGLRAALACLPRQALGRFESDGEMAVRMEEDLALCAATLRDRLGHPVHALAWPWGASNETSRDIARSLGFRLLFATSHGPNLPARCGSGLSGACTAPATLNRFKVGEHGPFRLLSRLFIYSRPGLAGLYGRIRIHKGRRG